MPTAPSSMNQLAMWCDHVGLPVLKTKLGSDGPTMMVSPGWAFGGVNAWVAPSGVASGASVVTGSGTANVTSVGTLTLEKDDRFGAYACFATAASAGGQGGANYVYHVARRGRAGNDNWGFFFHSRFFLPDASYDYTSGTSGSIIRVGVSDAGADSFTWNSNDDPYVMRICFERRNVASIQDTQWYVRTLSGQNEAIGQQFSGIIGTGVNATAGHAYHAALFSPAGEDVVYWWIKDLTNGEVGDGVVSRHILETTRNLYGWALVRTIDATSRKIGISKTFLGAVGK